MKFRHSFMRGILAGAGMLAAGSFSPLAAQDYELHEFETVPLTDVYYSEGAGAGDIDGDGVMDVVYGPYWFAGPDFQKKHEIYPAVPQPLKGYADNFFAWVTDFNGDGANDVFVVGFPGTPAHVYENPGHEQLDRLWEKHEVVDWVSNESPQFVNIVGDERPELVCSRDSRFGYATVNWDEPFQPWTFHNVSGKVTDGRFGHGLGVGDVNGDDRQDILFSGGWLEQPAELSENEWKLHEVAFTNAYGGADMFAYDVDGDGDNDVITSQAAHDFGLSWYEQTDADEGPAFKHHLIMGDRPDQNRFGLVFSELHSVALADMDGDGLQDIITGKTYYSHHEQSPMWDAGAVVYWFQLQRTDDGVQWVPHQAAADPGIGRQLGVFNLNDDDLPDLIMGGMKGAHVLLHHVKKVDEATWKAAQPKVYGGREAREDRGEASEIDESTGHAKNAVEGESMQVVSLSAGETTVQKMEGFPADRWSGGEQLFWMGATSTGKLELAFDVEKAGSYDIGVVLTTASDYAIVTLKLDGKPLQEALDLYEYPDVRTTGVLKCGTHKLKAGKHTLTIVTQGANASAKKAYMVGLDYLQLSPQE